MWWRRVFSVVAHYIMVRLQHATSMIVNVGSDHAHKATNLRQIKFKLNKGRTAGDLPQLSDWHQSDEANTKAVSGFRSDLHWVHQRITDCFRVIWCDKSCSTDLRMFKIIYGQSLWSQVKAHGQFPIRSGSAEHRTLSVLEIFYVKAFL